MLSALLCSAIRSNPVWNMHLQHFSVSGRFNLTVYETSVIEACTWISAQRRIILSKAHFLTVKR